MSKSAQPAGKADQGGQRAPKAEAPRRSSGDPAPRAPAKQASTKKK